MAKAEKTIEQTYTKKQLREHILLRPDSYVGSVQKHEQTLWVLSQDEQRFEERNIIFIPAFLKIFDEILVNASDNYVNTKKECIKLDKYKIKVVIDPQQGFISVWNNGKGIPVEIHKEEKVHVPELVFGFLLTGSNYDDNEKKLTGGRNGYGAKLTNIYSNKFIVECADQQRKVLFKKVWTKNMLEQEKYTTKPYQGESYTCITYFPDFSRFAKIQHEDWNPDLVINFQIQIFKLSLLKKRVFDIAGIYSGEIDVELNNSKIKIKTFKDYAKMFLHEHNESLIFHDPKMNTDRWEILVTFTKEAIFRQVSFVNSICTFSGGCHVEYIASEITKDILEVIKKKNPKLQIKPNQVKQYLWIFVNCLIENPTFDSQTKEKLTSQVSTFGSKPQISEKFINDITKSQAVIDTIVSAAKAQENSSLAKQLKGHKTRKLLGIEKLEDANDAGTKKSKECTLILTEGDSAKALAMAGVQVIGRDKFGVFPLRGKFLNVREAGIKQIKENLEVQNLIKIIGLEIEKDYQNVEQLRYGSVMIMTDQDTDGSHIKGLLINFFEYFWPSLFKMNGFLKEFITPIIKVRRKTGNQSIAFYSLGDFKTWQENNDLKYWNVKYYKGLGTSTDQEAIEYFKSIDRHKIQFQYQNDEDTQSIKLCFEKNQITQRKEWLANYNPDLNVDYNRSTLRYQDFVNQELIHFSNSDNIRSIPSICDGFKPGQRKVLFACFKRDLKNEIKVAQLGGYVAENSAYHHGEQSLSMTIIGMAQNFVGSNNINLLMPIGQFGTRSKGGKDHASARYLFTNLSKITRCIFPEDDDHSLDYLEDDNLVVEPRWYIPIIPMVLVNGAEGIGTGWSTNIPQYNPYAITDYIQKRLSNQEINQIDIDRITTPWYKGFRGEIIAQPETSKGKQFLCKGMLNEIEDETDLYEICDLPIKYHTQNRVNFQIQSAEGVINEWIRSDKIDKQLKLSSNLNTSNLVLFDKDCKLKKYRNVQDILNEFFDIRLEYYRKRKIYMISKLQREVDILQNKVQFIKLVIEDKIQIKNVKKKELVKSLVKIGLTPMNKLTVVNSTKLSAFRKQQKEDQKQEEIDSDEKEETNLQQKQNNNEISASQYKYLLDMSLWQLTFEQIEKLKKECDKKLNELECVKNQKEEDIWSNDLKVFIKILKEIEEKEEQERLEGLKEGKNTQKNKGQKVKPRKQKANKNQDNEKEVKKKNQKQGNSSAASSDCDKENKKNLANQNKKQNKSNDSSLDKSDEGDQDFSVKEEKKQVNNLKKKNAMIIESDNSKQEPPQKNIFDIPLAERLQAKIANQGGQQNDLLNNFKMTIEHQKPVYSQKLDKVEKMKQVKKRENVKKMKKQKQNRYDSSEEEESSNSFDGDIFPSQEIFNDSSNSECSEYSDLDFQKKGQAKYESKNTRKLNNQNEQISQRKVLKIVSQQDNQKEDEQINKINDIEDDSSEFIF